MKIKAKEKLQIFAIFMLALLVSCNILFFPGVVIESFNQSAKLKQKYTEINPVSVITSETIRCERMKELAFASKCPLDINPSSQVDKSDYSVFITDSGNLEISKTFPGLMPISISKIPFTRPGLSSLVYTSLAEKHNPNDFRYIPFTVNMYAVGCEPNRGDTCRADLSKALSEYQRLAGLWIYDIDKISLCT